jgi:hypothetical protein
VLPKNVDFHRQSIGRCICTCRGKEWTALTTEKTLQLTISPADLHRGGIAMGKRSLVLRYFVSLMLIATFVACASTPKRESTGEYVDDSVITTKIKSLILKDEFLKSFHISVKTYRGIVQLSGSVDSQKTVDKAGQIARSVKGVKSVKNKLVVK